MIHVYLLYVSVLFSVRFPFHPKAIDGGTVCVALANQNRYCMVNVLTGRVSTVDINSTESEDREVHTVPY